MVISIGIHNYIQYCTFLSSLYLNKLNINAKVNKISSHTFEHLYVITYNTKLQGLQLCRLQQIYKYIVLYVRKE